MSGNGTEEGTCKVCGAWSKGVSYRHHGTCLAHSTMVAGMKEDRLGPTQLCPKCGRQNASGFKLPEQCFWCAMDMLEDQRHSPREFSKTVDKHFWDLI